MRKGSELGLGLVKQKMLPTIKDATDRLRFLNAHRRHMRTRLNLEKYIFAKRFEGLKLN